MFIKVVPDNKNGKDGYYCSLVEAKWENGKSMHKVKANLGFIPSGRIPYLKAAFSKEEPELVLEREKDKMENMKDGKES